MNLIEDLEKNAMNMNDKFFHGVGCFVDYGLYERDKTRKERLLILKSILKSKYLKSKDLNSPIFLSVYPFGDYSKDYLGDLGSTSDLDGFNMSNYSFYLILSKDVKSEEELKAGNFFYECTIPSKFDYFKYLLGIGNVCNGIDRNLIISYILTKYVNGEISALEALMFFRRAYAPVTYKKEESEIAEGRVRTMYQDFFDPLQERNTLELAIALTKEELVDNVPYNEMIEILKQVNLSLPLYDRYGYLLEPQKLLEIAIKMQEYIRGNKSDTDTYSKGLRKLFEDVRKETNKK